MGEIERQIESDREGQKKSEIEKDKREMKKQSLLFESGVHYSRDKIIRNY